MESAIESCSLKMATHRGLLQSGPALTHVEVFVAIHDISPERDGLPLKKVDQTPLPLLFMRTVIQAIDAFPTLVDFVMEILSKLVNKQVWRMPKLWVGVLKCISHTQPRSFHLPSPQLESALNKYPSLRGPLTAFVNQTNVKTSMPSYAGDKSIVGFDSMGISGDSWRLYL